MKIYKKVYVEITNRCNRSCAFCVKPARPERDMSLEEIRKVFLSLEGRTQRIYLHVLGEPLLHRDLGAILDMAKERNFQINLTTNGTLLRNQMKTLISSSALRQLNISLHGAQSLEEAQGLADAALEVKSARDDLSLSFRLWRPEKMPNREISEYICGKLNVPAADMAVRSASGGELAKRVRLHLSDGFIWPSVNADKVSDDGFCLGLRDQFAILSDLTVVPCCLDAEGSAALGNLASRPLDEILFGGAAREIYNGFSSRKAEHPLCKRCGFRKRFDRP